LIDLVAGFQGLGSLQAPTPYGDGCRSDAGVRAEARSMRSACLASLRSRAWRDRRS
jgi:hypothetical protein